MNTRKSCVSCSGDRLTLQGQRGECGAAWALVTVMRMEVLMNLSASSKALEDDITLWRFL